MSLFSVNTNLGALAALQSLESTQQALNETQNEVSTGQKVSSAADNPAIYSIANTINANVAGLSAVSDSLNFGAQVVSTASSAVSSVSSVLDSLQQTVTSSNTSGESLTTLQNQVNSAIQSINQYALDATFSGVNLLVATAPSGGSNSLNVVQSVDGTVYTVGNLINPPPVGNAAATNNKTLSDALGLTSLSVLTGPDSSTASATQSIGAKLSLGATSSGAATTAGAFAYSSAGDAALTIYTGAQQTGGLPGATGDNTYTFEFVDSNKASSTPALQSTPSAGTNTNGVITGANQVIAVNIDTATQSTNQIIGALQSALTANGFGVVQNADGSLNIVGNGLTGAAFGYVLNSGSGFTSSSETDTSVTGADETLNSDGGNVADGTSGIEVQALSTNETAVTTVQNAVQQLNTISATLGAASQQITGIQNFTSALSSALTAGVGALTDADLATESAKLTSLQTKQQLATQSLSIAEQQPQSLLTLFKNA